MHLFMYLDVTAYVDERVSHLGFRVEVLLQSHHGGCRLPGCSYYFGSDVILARPTVSVFSPFGFTTVHALPLISFRVGGQSSRVGGHSSRVEGHSSRTQLSPIKLFDHKS